MKPLQLEILLFTDIRLSSGQFYEKYHPQTGLLTDKSLEEACWNGLFQEMLPALYKRVQNCEKLALWKITRADHFLELEFGKELRPKEKPFSMNPYTFLKTLLLS